MLAQYMPSLCVCLCVCVCVSVCPPVTLQYCIKVAKHKITQTNARDSPENLVFDAEKFKRDHPYGDTKRRVGLVKLATFGK